jgi:hypothetical protein
VVEHGLWMYGMVALIAVIIQQRVYVKVVKKIEFEKPKTLDILRRIHNVY